MSRRSVLKGAAAALPCGGLWPRNVLADTPLTVNDVTLMNETRVSRIALPRGTEDVRQAVGTWRGAICVGGGRYSMGGQIAEENSLHLDMRGFNRLVRFDPARRTVRVQTGMRWRDLQAVIDPYNLSVKIMQSYANFTVGGSLSVNAHGRYVGLGPIINSVRRLQVVLADGSVREASPLENAELFAGVIGGYGGLGVITEAELDLVPNVKLERIAHRVAIDDYLAFFGARILGDGRAVLHNADIDILNFNEVMAVTWRQTDKPVTVSERLFPAGAAYPLESAKVAALAELPGAHILRRAIFDPIEMARRPVVWRNREASMDVASLGRIAAWNNTYALQEYFVPVAAFGEFARRMMRILRNNGVNALNVSVRYSPADTISLLPWARTAVFSFVLYYRQGASLSAQSVVANWTRQLIAESLALGGTYYLPYQLHATRAQFARAYPSAGRFFALKAALDPNDRFRNRLWDKYRGA